MNRPTTIAMSACLALAGCAGQSSTGSYGSYDPTMNQSMGSSGIGSGKSGMPNAAAWPVEEGAPLVVRGIGMPSITFTSVDGKAPSYKSAAVETAMKDVAAIGFNTVRLTAFAGIAGLKVGKDGKVSGIEDTALKNLADAVERARAQKLRVYLTLNDGFKLLPKSPLVDKGAQEAYVKNVVAPLARKFKAHEAVLAFDLHSEIEKELSADAKAPVTWDNIRTYVKAATDGVKRQDPERLVSAGPASADVLRQAKLAGLTTDFYSLLHRDDMGTLPNAREMKLDRPILVGHATQASAEAKDELQASAFRGVIANSTPAGFAGYVLGSYSGDAVHSLIDKDGKHRKSVDAVRAALAEAKPVTEPKK